MRLLIDPDPPYLRWCRDSARGFKTGRGLPGGEWLRDAGRGRELARATSICHRLHHGGEYFHRPVTRATPKALAELRQAARHLPEHNKLNCEALRRTLELAPEVPQFILCETALFIDLPAPASSYAVPAELAGRGVRRYGGSGLLHQWAWERTRELCGEAAARMVSVQLGDHPNLAALKHGRPVDTTIGFTPVEGLPSRTGCGDIDPSVVFELRSSGMSLSEINELLSARSGFRALAGGPCGFLDLLEPAGVPGRAFVREVLVYDVVRQLGAFAAALGGVDALAFSVPEPGPAAGLLMEVCAQLDFLGARCRPPVGGAEAELISTDGPGVKVVVLKDDPWRVLSCRARAAEDKEG